MITILCFYKAADFALFEFIGCLIKSIDHLCTVRCLTLFIEIISHTAISCVFVGKFFKITAVLNFFKDVLGFCFLFCLICLCIFCSFCRLAVLVCLLHILRWNKNVLDFLKLAVCQFFLCKTFLSLFLYCFINLICQISLIIHCTDIFFIKAVGFFLRIRNSFKEFLHFLICRFFFLLCKLYFILISHAV